MKRCLLLLVLLPLLLTTPLQALAETPSPETTATAYYSATCGMCLDYIVQELGPTLGAAGLKTLTVKEFFYNREIQQEMVELVQGLNIPYELQGHILIKVRDLILMGHVPPAVVSDLLAPDAPHPYERLLVYQDEMHGGSSYKVWDFRSPAREYPISTPINTYLQTLAPKPSSTQPAGTGSLLPLVLGSGLVDGINPCAFAVMGYLVAFLYGIRRLRSHIIQTGIVYITAIFLTYFLLGVGLLGGFRLPGPTHIVGTVGAYLVIALGLINIKDYFWPSFPLRLTMPRPSWELTRSWVQRATFPSAAVAGGLVGLCTLPCSGGIYVAVLGLLTVRATYAAGLGYLGLYNLMYILPLVMILVLTTNRFTARGLAVWERGHTRLTHLLFGLFMVALGVAILLWFL